MQPTITGLRGAVPLIICLAATPLVAQTPCEPTDTIARCVSRHLQMDPAMNRVQTKERSDLRSQPTGVDTGGISVVTNQKDFNPLLALAGLLGTVPQGEDQAEGTLVLDFNFPLPGAMGAKNAQLQALVNTQPQLSELVRDAIPLDGRDDRISLLEEEIAGLADHTIRFTYNHTGRFLGRSHGRSFEQYEKGFEDLCADAMTAELIGQTLRALDTAPDQPFTDLAEESKARILQAAETNAGQRQLTDLADQALVAANVAGYDQLVGNQPQLHITAQKRFREPLVGPDETSVRVTYEWSMGKMNLNGVTEDCGKDWWRDSACFKEFVDNNASAIVRGHRLSMFAEYVDVEGERIDIGLPDRGPLASESARKLVLSLDWGRNFTFDGSPVKLDLAASYEDVSDDPMRQDRGIVRLTFTPKVGEMSIPFGIVYANHGEFLPEVDARLSAHIGLNFKMSGMNGGGP